MHCALVCHYGVSVTSQPTQEVALTVGPPGLVRLAFLDQLVEIERLSKPFGLERIDELGMKIRGLAVTFA